MCTMNSVYYLMYCSIDTLAIKSSYMPALTSLTTYLTTQVDFIVSTWNYGVFVVIANHNSEFVQCIIV